MNALTYDPSKLYGVYLEHFNRYGGLTELQIFALNEFDTKVNVDHIVRAFQTAFENGTKQPKVHVNGFVFKYATRGSTPGAIFVIADNEFDEYLGKIHLGKFRPVPACTPEQEQAILAAAANPLEAIVAFGRQTGKCSICHRPLTDPKSVDAGVGPICLKKFGL